MPAGSTYTPIATTTLGSAQATVTFSSIPSTYTDLVLVGNAAVTSTGNTVYVRLNSDSGLNYSVTVLDGNGSSAFSGRHNRTTNGGDGMAIGDWRQGFSTSRFSFNFNLMNYSNTTTLKTGLTRWSQADTSTEAIVSLWNSTAAVNELTVRINTGGINFVSGSTFTLYGIAAA
jgi:hypothetical protein